VLDGSHLATIDDRGRVKVPAVFRKQIQEHFGTTTFFITSVKGDCALVYPARSWQGIKDRIASQPPSRSPVRKFRRATSYYGQSAAMDPQGRLLIHPRLRVDAGLDEEVLVMGQVDHLEVWNHARFKETLVSEPMTGSDEDFLASLGV